MLASSRNGKVLKKESNIFSRHIVQANFLFHRSNCLETSRVLIMHLSCVIPSTDLHKFDWAQVALINPLNTSLNFFTRTLVTGLTRTWIGSKYTRGEGKPHRTYLWQFFLNLIDYLRGEGKPINGKATSWRSFEA